MDPSLRGGRRDLSSSSSKVLLLMIMLDEGTNTLYEFGENCSELSDDSILGSFVKSIGGGGGMVNIG